MTTGAGRLRHRVTLQQPLKSQDATGAEVLSWSTVTTVWAEVLELRGREYLAEREVHSDVTAKIRIRYRADVTVEWHVLFGTHTYDVTHAVDLMGRRRELELMCSEVV